MFSRTDFIERCSFWANNGGQWSSVNPDFKKGDLAPEGFEYHVKQEPSEASLGFSIYAIGEGTKFVIWRGYHYWHSLKNRSFYLSLGSRGEVCTGETYKEHDMYFEILQTSGQVMYILNHDEIVNKNEIQSSTQSFVEGQWKPMSSLHWRRII